MKQLLRLLSVDWDFFFPTYEHLPEQYWLWDWRYRETEFNIGPIWPIRAATFLHHKQPLPMTSGDEKQFWSRFEFSPSTRLYLAESHVYAAAPQVRKDITEVWNFDAHHDCGYGVSIEEEYMREWDCSNWMMRYLGAKRHVVYPSWKGSQRDGPRIVKQIHIQVDDGKQSYGTFDRVFVCRSGAWAPPWIDRQFRTFLRTCPVQERVTLQPFQKRKCSHPEVRKLVRKEKTLCPRLKTLLLKPLK
jgi:hypothetical protein